MLVLLVRHAKAEQRASLGPGLKRDARRRRTEAGRARMRRIAMTLHKLVPSLDVLAASPLVRARETATIIARRYDDTPVLDLAPLSPGGSEQELLQWLREQRADATVALVGHEPDLGLFASWLLSGRKLSFCPLRKAGACLISFDDTPAPGGGVLEWWLPPGLLDKLNRGR